jgi:group I intron endonuclease
VIFPKDAKRRIGGIYAITCLLSGKCYVGSAVDLWGRFRAHLSDLRLNKHRGPRLQNAWNKYGEEAFSYEILEFGDDKFALIEREQLYIDLLGAAGVWGYNTAPTAGSMAGYRHTPESLAKMSAAHKARPVSEHLAAGRLLRPGHSAATRVKLRERALARAPMSQATRDKLSAAGIGRKNPASPETRIKMSIAAKNRVSVLTDEGRAAIAESNRRTWTGRKHKPESIAKTRETKARIAAAKAGNQLQLFEAAA